jgi:hypothetical protein
VPARRTKGTNVVELQCVHSSPVLLNSQNLLHQNKTDHIQLNRIYYLSKTRRQEALWKTVNIQEKNFLHPNEYLHTLIKDIIRRNGLKIKLKVRELQGVLSTL